MACVSRYFGVRFGGDVRQTSLATVVVVAIAAAAQCGSLSAAERLGLEFVPANSCYVISMRPGELAAADDVGELTRFAENMSPLNELGLSVPDISELMIIRYGWLYGNTRVVVRFGDAGQRRAFVDGLVQKREMNRVTNANAWQDALQRVEVLDPSTLVIDDVEMQRGFSPAPIKNAAPRWAKAWQERNERPILVALDLQTTMKSSLNVTPTLRISPEAFETLYPLLLWTDWAVADVQMKDKLQVGTVVESMGEEKAAAVGDTLKAFSILLRNMARLYDLRREQGFVDESEEAGTSAVIRQISKEVGKLLESGEFEVEGRRVNVSFQSPLAARDIGKLAAAMLPVIENRGERTRRLIAANHMRQISLGLLNYESAKRHFPSAVSYTYRKDGQTVRSEYPHSWRIDVLPFLEVQQANYDAYRFDEPWDSEANKKILARMPDVFRSPHDPDPNSTNTSYFALTGPDAVFDGEEQAGLRHIVDGASNTILIVEAKRAVPWTKPDDIPYAADKPLPKLGGWVPGEVLIGTADGGVSEVSAEIADATLRAHITKAGRENAEGLPVLRSRE
jgi:hypothetical protein